MCLDSKTEKNGVPDIKTFLKFSLKLIYSQTQHKLYRKNLKILINYVLCHYRSTYNVKL